MIFLIEDKYNLLVANVDTENTDAKRDIIKFRKINDHKIFTSVTNPDGTFIICSINNTRIMDGISSTRDNITLAKKTDEKYSFDVL